MSRFARLFVFLMEWDLEGWWSLTNPMREREWVRYYVDFDEADDIIRDERPEEDVDADVSMDRRLMSRSSVVTTKPDNAGFARAMELGRKRLGWSEDM